MRISRKLAALAAFFVIGAVIAGCGSSVPGNSVASVAGNPISLQAFNHWMYVAAKQQAAQYAQEGVSEPPIISSNPTNFKSCEAEIRAGIPQLRTTPAATLAKDCKQVFTQYSTEVMNYLIQGYWLQADAHRIGVDTSKITTAFNKAIKKEFKTKAQLKTYLGQSGQTEDDMRFQYRVSSIYAKLVKRQQKPVTSAQIAAYYSAHKSTFGTPASRNLHLIRTKTKSQAQAAYNALKGGQSWAKVATQYAADASSKKNGGALSGVTAGEEESAANKAIFSAALNTLVGPVKGVFGYYVIEVTKITAGTQQSLAQATKSIKTQLTTTAQTAAETKVAATAKKNWMSKTTCRAAFATSYCPNYKAPKTTTAATTTPTVTASGSATGTVTSSGTASSTTTTSATATAAGTTTTK